MNTEIQKRKTFHVSKLNHATSFRMDLLLQTQNFQCVKIKFFWFVWLIAGTYSLAFLSNLFLLL